jgi:hypothetical protein
MSQLPSVLFPVLAIEVFDFNLTKSGRINTAKIDAITIGIRTGKVERFYTTGFAEIVFGNTTIKRIGSYLIPTGD